MDYNLNRFSMKTFPTNNNITDCRKLKLENQSFYLNAFPDETHLVDIGMNISRFLPMIFVMVGYRLKICHLIITL